MKKTIVLATAILTVSAVCAPLYAATVRNLSGASRTNLVPGRAATATSARATTAPRLSIGRLHSNAGKTISGGGTSTGGNTTPGGPGGNDVDLSNYATIDMVDAIEGDIVNIETDIGEIRAGLDDVYTKTEVDDIISDLELNGVPGADGASAYEVAVANGFIGTEAQWLESLKGEPGSAADLSDYPTFDDMTTALADKADSDTTYSKTEVDAIVDGIISGEIDLSDYATIASVTTALADKADSATTYTKTEVDGIVAAIEGADLSVYATKVELADKADKSTTYTIDVVDELLFEKADKTTTYTMAQVDALIDGIVAGEIDLSDYATTASVTTALAEKANQSSTYTMAQVDALIDGIVAGEIDLSDYATIDALTTALATKADASALAAKADQATTYTKTEVDNIVAAIEAGEVDLSAYSTTEQMNAALSTKADQSTTYTKTEVDGLLDGISAPDLSDYATKTELGAKADQATTYTKTEVDTLVSGLNTAIAALQTAMGEIEEPDLSAYATKTEMNTALTNKEDKIVGGATGTGKVLTGTSTGWQWAAGGTSPNVCNPACTSGQTCVNGTCVGGGEVLPDCITANCPAGQICPVSGKGDCYDPNVFEW